MSVLRRLLLLFLIAICSTSYSQLSHINISGTIKDTLNEDVAFATVMLLNPKDSTLVNFTTTNINGYFDFKNVKNSGYLLKISHVSYMPLQKTIKVSDTKNLELGIIRVKPFSELLMEVVVKDARAPLFIRGDTVEYDARTFKVPPGSTVEDLLRRLPGIDVDDQGNISTMGKDVKRIYVDGKTFFSEDPTVVTKNLDAESVSKVQVFDEKSEQERLTGIADGEKEKVMNLELKEEYKKGQFGKASVAAGTENRYAGRGNYNRFNESMQLSFIGYGNNINETGVNWDDYSEFKGQSAFSGRDNGDFGFGSGYGRYFFGDGLFDYFDGRGFTKNLGGGANYNYFNKKTQINFSYVYNQTDLDIDQFTETHTFLTDTSYYRNDTLDYGEFRNSQNISSRLELKPDSMNNIIFIASSRISGKSDNELQSQLFRAADLTGINRNIITNSTDFDSWTVNALGIYSHKFKRKGRRFALSGAYDLKNDNTFESVNNLNYFLITANNPDLLKYITEKTTDYKRIKSSALYVEPLGKRFSVLLFYNFNSSENISGNSAKNSADDTDIIDSLSLYNPVSVLYNRAGSQLNYSYNGINVSVGGARQSIMMEGKYSVVENSQEIVPAVKRTYNNWTPFFSFNSELPNNIYIDFDYEYDIEEPDVSYLQPAPNLSNPFYRVEGNPSLVPEESHSFSGRISRWDRSSMTSISLSSSYDITQHSIVYNQTAQFIDGTGYVTFLYPENVSGGNTLRNYIWASFPIIKTKISMNVNGYMNTSDYIQYINGIENNTKRQNYNGTLSLNLTPGKKLNFNLYVSEGVGTVDYSIQKDQGQVNYNNSAGCSFKYQFAKKSYLEGNYKYTSYQSENNVFDRDFNLINISIRQILGKKNRFEARLSAFDLLNEREYIQQYGSQNKMTYTLSPTLARYFLIGISYNLKGFELNQKKSR